MIVRLGWCYEVALNWFKLTNLTKIKDHCGVFSNSDCSSIEFKSIGHREFRMYLDAHHFATHPRQLLLRRVNGQSTDAVRQLCVLLVLVNCIRHQTSRYKNQTCFHKNYSCQGGQGRLALVRWAGRSAGLVGRHVKCCRKEWNGGGGPSLDKVFAGPPEFLVMQQLMGPVCLISHKGPVWRASPSWFILEQRSGYISTTLVRWCINVYIVRLSSVMF